MTSDLAGIRQDAQAAQSCLVTSNPRVSETLLDLEKKVTALSELLSETQNQLSLKTQGEKRLEISRPTTNLPLHTSTEMFSASPVLSMLNIFAIRVPTVLENLQI